MSAPVYASYRDSQLEWLSQVPSHWEVVRLNTLFREVAEPGSDDLPVLSVSIHSGVSDTELADDEVDRVVARSEDRSKYKRVEPNDLVYNMMRAWQGGFGTVQTSGAVSPAYVVARPTSGQSTRYVERLLRTPNAVGEMKRLSKGVTDFRLRLYWDEFKNIKIALPPVDEQLAIDAFLNRETAKIDALVEAQRRLIELLKEKRQAVISHAVTKGLDPSAPVKDSGVGWLGQVPAHWRVTAIKRLCSRITDGAHISPETEGGVYCFVSTRDVSLEGIDFEGCLRTSEASYEYLLRTGCQPEVGDVLFSKDGTVGRTVVVRDRHDFVVASSLIIIRPIATFLDSEFLDFLCQSDVVQNQVESFVKGAGLPRLSISNLMRVVGVFPPISEQGEIANLLADISMQFAALVREAEAAITLLQERRAALISAAVTGKIDVRGLAQTAEAA